MLGSTQPSGGSYTVVDPGTCSQALCCCHWTLGHSTFGHMIANILKWDSSAQQVPATLLQLADPSIGCLLRLVCPGCLNDPRLGVLVELKKAQVSFDGHGTSGEVCFPTR